MIFEDCKRFLEQRIGLVRGKVWKVVDSTNEATLEHRESGARVRCLGSDGKRAHSLRSYLALADEGAQWDGNRGDAMLAALRTGMGKVPGSRLIALGTRPASPAHWFSTMLDNAAYSQVHAARDDDPPFAKRTLRRANPSYDYLPSLRERLAIEMGEAKADPAMLASFLALRLNKGVSDTVENVLLSADAMRPAMREAKAEGPCWWGVDLGGTAALSAVAAYWPVTGRCEVFAAFPGVPGLAERGLRDSVGRLCVDMAARRELVVHPGRTVSVDELMREALRRFGQPSGVSADRWREGRIARRTRQRPRARLSVDAARSRIPGWIGGCSQLQNRRARGPRGRSRRAG